MGFFLHCALKKQKEKKLSSRNCKLYNGMNVWFSKEGNHISASALGFGQSDVGFVVFMSFAKFEKKQNKEDEACERLTCYATVYVLWYTFWSHHRK